MKAPPGIDIGVNQVKYYGLNSHFTDLNKPVDDGICDSGKS